MHSFYPPGQGTTSNWTSPLLNQLVDSSLTENDFSVITAFDDGTVPLKFLLPPRNPAYPTILRNYDYVSLGTVNVTDSSLYNKADAATIKAFRKCSCVYRPMSVETTHGLIRALLDAPFLFVSGITNRVGLYANEVLPQPYAQDTAAANNAGVALAYMLPKIASVLV